MINKLKNKKVAKKWRNSFEMTQKNYKIQKES